MCRGPSSLPVVKLVRCHSIVSVRRSETGRVFRGCLFRRVLAWPRGSRVLPLHCAFPCLSASSPVLVSDVSCSICNPPSAGDLGIRLEWAASSGLCPFLDLCVALCPSSVSKSRARAEIATCFVLRSLSLATARRLALSRIDLHRHLFASHHLLRTPMPSGRRSCPLLFPLSAPIRSGATLPRRAARWHPSRGAPRLPASGQPE